MLAVTKLRMTQGQTQFLVSKPLKTYKKQENSQKTHFPEKRGCEYQPLTVEPPSSATQTRSAGRQTDRSGDAERRECEKISEVIEAGRAKLVRAHPVTFVSTLFEIDSF